MLLGKLRSSNNRIASFELKMKFDLLLSPDRKRMFIWNNIFFSFAFDSRDHFQELGGKLSLWYFCFYDVKIGFGAKTLFWCFLFFVFFFQVMRLLILLQYVVVCLPSFVYQKTNFEFNILSCVLQTLLFK